MATAHALVLPTCAALDVVVALLPRFQDPVHPAHAAALPAWQPACPRRPLALQVSAARQHAASLHRRQAAVEAEAATATGRLQAQLKV